MLVERVLEKCHSLDRPRRVATELARCDFDRLNQAAEKFNMSNPYLLRGIILAFLDEVDKLPESDE